jgi:hypothetical protein
MGADAVKHITKIPEWIDLTQFPTGDKAVDDSGSFGTSVASGKEPISSSEGNDPQNAFSEIVVNVEVTIFGVLIQSDPLPPGVTDGLADGTFGKNLNRSVFQTNTNLIKNRLAVLLA